MIVINEIIELVTITVNEQDVVNVVISETITPLTINVADVGLQGPQGIQGLPGQNAVLPVKVYQEIPTGVINGINATFTSLFNFEAGTVDLYINGLFQKIIQDFNTVGNNTITLVNPPNSTENILINYIKL
jgi:hypothetical protein